MLLASGKGLLRMHIYHIYALHDSALLSKVSLFGVYRLYPIWIVKVFDVHALSCLSVW